MAWRHFSDKVVKTCVDHTCELCGKPIKCFTEAMRRRGSMDGKPTSFMMHLDCEEVSRQWDEVDWITNDPAQFAFEMEVTRAERSQHN